VAGFFLSGKAKGIREGSHVVFFRKAGNEVEIVRVLHERMLPGKHLP
jgi:plasmid stabilization system protein ParE